MARGIIFSFWFTFILFLPYFRFRSVLPNLWASSGQISEALQASSANCIGAILKVLLALCRSLRLKAKQGVFATPIGEARRICSANKKFLWIFFYALRFAY